MRSRTILETDRPVFVCGYTEILLSFTDGGIFVFLPVKREK